MQLAGSDRGIIRELNFDEPALLEKLHSFCILCNKLSMSVSCFSELYDTDYGQRFLWKGVVQGRVRKNTHA